MVTFNNLRYIYQYESKNQTFRPTQSYYTQFRQNCLSNCQGLRHRRITFAFLSERPKRFGDEQNRPFSRVFPARTSKKKFKNPQKDLTYTYLRVKYILFK